MKTVVSIIVYSRFENIERWVRCWHKCDQTDAELVVIQNTDEKVRPDQIRSYCEVNGIKYFERENIGMDIGAFKDVCQGKIDGFPDFDNLLWITDDCIPMTKDFVSLFTHDLKGLNCLEISNIKSPLHVRTTGFCITKEIANRLQFGNIVTKMDCYDFEHRGNNTLMLQVKRMGFECKQLGPIERASLWDTGNRVHLNRMKEHESVFSDVDRGKVTIICPVFNTFPQIISAFQTQTYQNWEIFFIHDGKGKMDLPKDKRIHFQSTSERLGNYGHHIRAEYLQKLKNNGKYLLITNADNYYMPDFLMRAIQTLEANPDAVAAYSQQIIHNYTGWGVMNCRMQRGFIDCGGVLLRSLEAASVGWNSLDHSSDWIFFNDIMNKFGSKSFVPFDGCHFVHN